MLDLLKNTFINLLYVNNFIVVYFKFLILYIFLYLLGKSLLIITSKLSKINLNNKLKIQNIEVSAFYPLLGLFFMGNILVVWNFIFPINKYAFIPLFSIIILGLKNLDYKDIIRKLLRFTPVYLILLISSYDMNFHYDAGLYHLLNQAWLRESNIVLGFSNIYGPLGVSSIYEYILSFFWFDTTYIYLHLVSLIFVVVFYEFIYICMFISKDKLLQNVGFAVLIFSILDNFGYGGGRNGFIYIQGISKQDTAIAITVFLISVVILKSILESQYEQLDLIIVLYLSLFVFQLKVSGIVIVVLLVFYIARFVSKKYFLKTALVLPMLLFGIWLLKSILQTGCFIFPLAKSCIKNLSWVDVNYIKTVENVSVEYSFSYYFNENFLIWFNQYLDIGINRNVLLNYAISIFIIFLLFLKRNARTSNLYNNSIILIYFLLSLFFYIRFGPDIRYLMNVFLLGVISVGFLKRPTFKISKNFMLLFFICSLISFVRLNSYKNFDFFDHPNYSIEDPNLVEFDDRYIPSESDQCWDDVNCSASYYSYKIVSKKYFKIVEIDN